MIADNGRIVARAGNSSTSPIWMFERNLETYQEIGGPSTGFSALGQYPGISDAGNTIVFFGDLTDSALAVQYGTTNGPGIFTYFPDNPKFVRIASLKTSDPKDTNIVATISADDRVNINSGGYTIFLGTTLTGQKALFRNKLNLFSRTCDPLKVEEVLKVGDSIDGLDSTVADLGIWDSINNSPHPGQMACTVTMSGGVQGVVIIQDKCIENSLTMHQAGRAVLQFSATDGLDEPIPIKADFLPLFAQTRVTNGLVADGVTPLLLGFSPTNSPNTNMEFKIRVEIDAATGTLGTQIEDHIYVHDGSAFVHSDSITVSPARPTNFLYISGIRADDVNLAPGSKALSIFVSFDFNGASGCPHEIQIAKPPIVLVHGYNADMNTWSPEFLETLSTPRPENFVTRIEYGVKIGPNGERDKTENTVGKFRNLAWTLNNKLGEFELPTSNLRNNWAFTRYDVIAHSQGGVLMRFLNLAVGPSWQLARKRSDYFRGRFQRIITINSPHNGSVIPYYLDQRGKYFGAPLLYLTYLPSLKKIFQDKFFPFGDDIAEANSLPVDPGSRFHAIRTTLADGEPPSPLNCANPYSIMGLELCLPFVGSILLPRGSDGVVDFDAMVGGPSTKQTTITGLNISHSGPEILFGVGPGSTATQNSEVADHAIALLDGSETAFGPFINPIPLDSVRKAQIDTLATTFKIIGLINLVKKFIPNPPPLIQGLVAQPCLEFLMEPRVSEPIVGEVRWTYEVYSTNGISHEGVSLSVDPKDFRHVTICADPDMRGTVVLYASYLSTNQTLVFPNGVVALERSVGTSLVGILLKPSDPILAEGESVEPTIWGVFDNGMISQLFVSPESPLLLTSSDNFIVSVNSNTEAKLLRPGTATITATYENFSNQTTFTVLGPVTEPKLSAVRDLADGTVLVTLSGSAGRRHIIESSGDLLNWEPLSTNTLTSNGVFRFNAPTKPSVAQFYRASLRP